MAGTERFEVVSRYLEEGNGWKTEREIFEGSFENAGRQASAKAQELDKRFGDGHFWTVDLYNAEKREYGSYFQLFHGRLS